MIPRFSIGRILVILVVVFMVMSFLPALAGVFSESGYDAPLPQLQEAGTRGSGP